MPLHRGLLPSFLAFLALFGLVFAGVSSADEQETAVQSEVAEQGVAEASPESDPRSLETLLLTCAACHGQTGNATIATYPNMGGQNAKYLERQMLLIRSGERDVPLMVGQLDSWSDDDIRAAAEFYAAQPKVTLQAKPERIELGESIYRGGILSKNVAACTACHSPNGDGNSLAGFPRVAGQPIEYTVAQLTAYREDQRVSDEDYGGMMRDVAKNLTDTEIEAVANYIKGLY